jgi:hypothetical protein
MPRVTNVGFSVVDLGGRTSAFGREQSIVRTAIDLKAGHDESPLLHSPQRIEDATRDSLDREVGS